MEKLTAREKVGVYCLMIIVRWMMPTQEKEAPIKQLFDDVQHQIRCSL